MASLTYQPVVNDASIKTVSFLARKIWREHYTPLIGAAQVEYMLDKFQSPAAIQSQIAEGTTYFLVLGSPDNPIGYLSWIPDGTSLFLSKFYIGKENRGQGRGRQAMEYVKTRAKEMGFKKVNLTVHKRNPSLQAYQKMGFGISGPVTTDIGEGFVMDDYRMEIRVS